MRKNSPLYIEDLYLCTFSSNDYEENNGRINQLIFDRRHDFLIDSTFAGIAVQIDFSNSRYFTGNDKGVRRNTSIILIDTTSRCEVSKQTQKVNIHKDDPYLSVYLTFPISTTDFKPGHTYKLLVRDDNASITLTEQVFHLFGLQELGHPAEWYTIESGGIRPDLEKNGLYRSIKVEPHKQLNVRFNLRHNFGEKSPIIMPELELRLYYPNDNHIDTRFIEPRCTDYITDLYSVELPFFTSDLYDSAFYAEVLCMQYPIAGFVFSTNKQEVVGDWSGEGLDPLEEYSRNAANDRLNRLLSTDDTTDEDEFEAALNRFISEELEYFDDEDILSDSDDTTIQPVNTNEDTMSDIPLLESLDHLTGLRSVKEKLTVYERIVRFNKMRAEKGLSVSSTPLHAMFLGSPGTGKTTVAQMIGTMLHQAGLLSKGHVVIRERATLLGQNYSAESEKTIAAIEEAQGGILLIDEAYQLYQPNDPRDPGKFVIETLLTTLADSSKRDWMLILAGYPDEMKRMFDMNPGFKSRIPDSNIYIFDDFTESELMEIAEKYLARHQYTLAPDAHTALADRLKSDYSRREKNFGNARHVINMIQTEILPAMAVRVTEEETMNDTSLTEIQAVDIPRATTMPISSHPHVGFAF